MSLRYDTPILWREFVSVRGIIIRAAFNPDTATNKAENICIFVEAPVALLKSKTEVTAVVINFTQQGEIVQKKLLQLLFRTEADTVFSASIKGGVKMGCPFQIAVKLDGTWEVDPIQPGEEHNFNAVW